MYNTSIYSRQKTNKRDRERERCYSTKYEQRSFYNEDDRIQGSCYAIRSSKKDDILCTNSVSLGTDTNKAKRGEKHPVRDRALNMLCPETRRRRWRQIRPVNELKKRKKKSRLKKRNSDEVSEEAKGLTMVHRCHIATRWRVRRGGRQFDVVLVIYFPDQSDVHHWSNVIHFGDVRLFFEIENETSTD